MATPEVKALTRALILKITRANFKQARKDSNGYLYTSGTYQFRLPYSVVTGAITPSYLAELSAKFDEVRSRRDAEYGRPRPVEMMEAVPNPEDFLKEETGGQPGAGPEAMNLAEAGSTPAPPSITTAIEIGQWPKPDREKPAQADAGWDTGIATPAVEGSSPSVGTTPSTQYAGIPHITLNAEETTTMAPKLNKRGRRIPPGFTCPKCGKKLAVMGRHAQSCPGVKTEIMEEVDRKVNARPSKRSAPERAEVAHTNGHTSVDNYRQHLTAFTKATADFLVLVEALQGMVKTYQRENDELRQFKQRASALFGPVPKVPRA